MSAHSEIIRDYIELRNFLAQSHPQPNMNFEVAFEIRHGQLLAISSISHGSIEICRIQPHFWRLYIPHHGVRFETFSMALINFVNLRSKNCEPKGIQKSILSLATQFKNNLDLKAGYEPKN